MKLLSLPVLLVGLLSPLLLLGQSGNPWLPPQGELSLNPGYVFETFRDYYEGSDKRDLPFGDVVTNRFLIGAEYSILKDLAVDASTGFVTTTTSQTESDDGIDDTILGVRYRILDEEEERIPAYAPTVTLRAAAIIEGDYNTNSRASPGKGASGFDAALQLGKIINIIDVLVFADAGYRFYGHDIPDAFFTSVGVSKLLLDTILVKAAFHHLQSLVGKDVDASDFQVFDFQEQKEFSETVSVRIGYQEVGGRYFGIELGHVFSGRNTAARLMFGVSAVLPF